MTLLKDIITRCIEAINALEEVTRQNEKEIKEVYGENQKLRDSIRQLDLRSKCFYCGEVIDERPYEEKNDPEIAEKCKQHVLACKKSPSYQLRVQVDELQKENDKLKQAHAKDTAMLIADRDKHMRAAANWQGEVCKAQKEIRDLWQELEQLRSSKYRQGALEKLLLIAIKPAKLAIEFKYHGSDLRIQAQAETYSPSLSGEPMAKGASRVISNDRMAYLKVPELAIRGAIEGLLEDLCLLPSTPTG